MTERCETRRALWNISARFCCQVHLHTHMLLLLYPTTVRTILKGVPERKIFRT